MPTWVLASGQKTTVYNFLLLSVKLNSFGNLTSEKHIFALSGLFVTV